MPTKRHRSVRRIKIMQPKKWATHVIFLTTCKIFKPELILNCKNQRPLIGEKLPSNFKTLLNWIGRLNKERCVFQHPYKGNVIKSVGMAKIGDIFTIDGDIRQITATLGRNFRSTQTSFNGDDSCTSLTQITSDRATPTAQLKDAISSFELKGP